MLLNRHRLLRLIELAELERRVLGPERMLREEDVALLVKAAYDDATDLARAEFLNRVRPMPTSAWPWSAVQAMTPRSGNARGGGGGANVVYSPAPGALAPAALVLLRGQADGADADPGNRVPDRGQPDAAAWESLHKALDLWDTATIKKWIGPQGWVAGGMATSQAPSGGVASPNGGGVGGQPNGGPNGGGQPNDGGQPSGSTGQTETSPPTAMPFSWRHPAVFVTGATVATTVGVTLLALRSRRRRPVPLAAPAASSPTTTVPGPPVGAGPRPSGEPT
jgi:hypothetical protein